MNTYKIGNKVTGIIRSCAAGNIGDVYMEYSNQPYTVLEGMEIQLDFVDIDSVSKSRFTNIFYNNSKLDRVTISNVLLTDKILNLIFKKSKAKLISRVENYEADNGILYVNAPTDVIYQVFVYNDKQQLEFSVDSLTNMNIPVSGEGNYLVCYQYEALLAYSLDRTDNQYLTLDLIVTGNKNDNTQLMNIHIEKCGLKIDKNMYFNQRSNSIDLIFQVIDTENNYITIK